MINAQKKAFVVAVTFGCLAGAAAGQGPDVIAGDITGPQKWGTINGVTAYSIGTEACNIGNVEALWDDETNDGTPGNRHPVIAQNIFRLHNGRFEQLGQSWLKHSFFALQLNGLCTNTCQPSPQGGNYALGPGCSDPYDTGLNGSQGGLGPKFEVDPTKGLYPWPFTGDGQTGNTLFKRIQVRNDDLNPALNPGALYFGEGQYTSPDDAAANNDNNNASYRRINVGSLSGGGYNLSFTGSTQRTKPAIQAWKDFDPSVTLNTLDVPFDGRFLIAFKVTDNGNGTWDYEYAIQNLNSNRAGGSFSVPVGDNVTITNVGFHDVDYHSGEPFDNTDWTSTVTANSVTWTSPNTHAVDPNSNALRWGTLYNFRFTADSPPQSVDAVLSMFKPSTVNNFVVPGAGPQDIFDCVADANGDGALTPADFSAWVAAFNTSAPECDQNGDSSCTPADFSAWVANYNAGC